MSNICIVELKKDKNNFFHAGQSIATVCIRDYLKRNGISSMIYMDDSLPSLNDLAEDILSVADDALVFIADEDNCSIVEALIHRIKALEDITIYLMGDDTHITEQPERKLIKELTGNENSCISIMECSPYQTGIVLPQDAAEYGIWLGRSDMNGNTEFRSTSAISSDCAAISAAFSGLSEEHRKKITLQGPEIRQKELALQVMDALQSDSNSSVQYILPVDFIVAVEIEPSDTTTIIYDLFITEPIDDKNIQKLNRIAQENKVNEVIVKADTLIHSQALRIALMEGVKHKLFQLIVKGQMDFGLLSEEEETILLKQTSLRYAPFSRGFLKSRTGMYNTVNLDGYVKHVEVAEEDYNEDIASYLNEIASINSSVYIRGLTTMVNHTQSYFDNSGIGKVVDSAYQNYCNTVCKADATPSNLLQLQDNTLRVNDFFYTSKQGIKELAYKQAKAMIGDIQNEFKKHKGLFYIFSIEDEEDYQCFLSDAEQYKDIHDFAGLPLAYGYLKNYCRFMNSKCCFVDKIPRIQLSRDGNLYTCFNKEEAIGQIGQTIFELTQNCYVKKENEIKNRDCIHCKAKGWCAKCTQLPSFMKNSYCTIMKDKSYVIDYIMSSLACIQLVTTIPKFSTTHPANIKVSSEYMYNFTSTIDDGQEIPYFPKFTYVLHNGETSVLWTVATNKFFNISREYAFVAELLLKRLPVMDFPGYFSMLYNMPIDQSKEVCTHIIDTINQSGTLYRPIKEN